MAIASELQASAPSRRLEAQIPGMGWYGMVWVRTRETNELDFQLFLSNIE